MITTQRHYLAIVASGCKKRLDTMYSQLEKKVKESCDKYDNGSMHTEDMEVIRKATEELKKAIGKLGAIEMGLPLFADDEPK